MSPVFTARRRAEEFHALLDGTADEQVDARYAELVRLVGELREAPEVTARPAFVADLRERLMAEAETALDPQLGVENKLTVVPRDPSARRRDRRVAAAVAGFALVGASTGMAVAAQSALPGDALYPLKRAIENAETGIRVDEDAKGKTLLENASGRLTEVDQLTRSDEQAKIAETLHTFTEQASAASNLLLADYAATGETDSVERLRDFTADSMAQLSALETLVPESARASLIEAASTLTQIDQQALIACPSCGPEVITKLPVVSHVSLEDLLGLEGLGPASTTRVPQKDTRRAKQQPPADRSPLEPRSTPDQPGAPKDTPGPRTPQNPGTGNGGGGAGDGGGGLLDDLTKSLTGGSGGKQGGQDGKKQDGGLLGDLGTTLGGLGSLLD